MQPELTFRTVEELIDYLKSAGITFASKFDETNFIGKFQYNFNILDIKMRVDEYLKSKVYTFCTSIQSNDTTLFLKNRFTVYADDGYAYFTNGRVLIPDLANNKLHVFPEPKGDFSYINASNICFKFIWMNTDVTIAHQHLNNQLIRMMRNHIANYLNNIGFACVNGDFFITMFVSETEILPIFNFLKSLDWREVMNPFANILRKISVKFHGERKQYKHIDINKDLTKLTLVIEIRISVDRIEISLYFKNAFFGFALNDMFYNIDGGYQIYDGWKFLPLLQPIYTNNQWCKNPIVDFKIYGRLQMFKIHPKYLPLMQLDVMEINGFQINGIDYIMGTPQFVDLNFPLESIGWNTYRMKQIQQHLYNPHGEQ
jgi:hypothetical protein